MQKRYTIESYAAELVKKKDERERKNIQKRIQGTEAQLVEVR